MLTAGGGTATESPAKEGAATESPAKEGTALEENASPEETTVPGDDTPGASLLERFLADLPFEPTGAQRSAIADICADLAGPLPMHRLLQGDVGAGKTVVAVATLLIAVQGERQGALMAPTEVLAEQHFFGVRALLQTCPSPTPPRSRATALSAWPSSPRRPRRQSGPGSMRASQTAPSTC